jgi:hypothetical protein
MLAGDRRTQWAAQFAVAAELCKRGYEVSFTMGNATPVADLMLVSPLKRMFLIDVKGLYRVSVTLSSVICVRLPVARMVWTCLDQQGVGTVLLVCIVASPDRAVVVGKASRKPIDGADTPPHPEASSRPDAA